MGSVYRLEAVSTWFSFLSGQRGEGTHLFIFWGGEETYNFAYGTLHSLLRWPAAAAVYLHPELAGREHFQDGGSLEAVRTLPAADRVPHRKQRQRTFEADPLRRDFEVVVVRIACGLAVGGVVRGRRARKPRGRVGHGTCVVFRMTRVVDDFLEADVVIIRRVSGKEHVSCVGNHRILATHLLRMDRV